VRAGAAAREPVLARERLQHGAAVAHLRRRLAEGLATAGTHLDLGRDQLPDQMRLELRPLRRRLDVLEAVDERERLRVEQRELLLDREREIRPAVVRLARRRQQLVVADLLFLAHAAGAYPADRARSAS